MMANFYTISMSISMLFMLSLVDGFLIPSSYINKVQMLSGKNPRSARYLFRDSLTCTEATLYDLMKKIVVYDTYLEVHEEFLRSSRDFIAQII